MEIQEKITRKTPLRSDLPATPERLIPSLYIKKLINSDSQKEATETAMYFV